MGTMLRGYRMRAYPTSRQEEILGGWQRAYAHVWNTALEQRKMCWSLYRRSIGVAEQSRQMPELRACEPAVAVAPAQVANEALRRLDLAYQAAFRRLREGCTARGESPGFPRFLAWRDAPLIFSADKRSQLSAQMDGCPSKTSGTYWIEAQRERGFVFGFSAPRETVPFGHLRVRNHRPLPALCRVKTMALTYRAGRWHVSVTVESPEVLREPCGEGVVGVNRGVVVWLATSDGELIEFEDVVKEYAARLADIQRCRSASKKGSRRWREHVRREGRLQATIAARRKQRANEVAERLLDRFGRIVLEDFDVRAMMRDDPVGVGDVHALRRRIADKAWGEFARILQYKAVERGATVEKVDPRGLTTTCSACGGDIGEEAAAAVRGRREVLCDCGARHHVDVNAAVNVLARAELVPA